MFIEEDKIRVQQDEQDERSQSMVYADKAAMGATVLSTIHEIQSSITSNPW